MLTTVKDFKSGNTGSNKASKFVGIDEYKKTLPVKVPLGQKILNGSEKVGEFFGGKGVMDYVGAKIAKSNATEAEKQFIEEPTTKQVLASAGELALNLVPIGMGLGAVSKVAKGAKAIDTLSKAKKVSALRKEASAIKGLTKTFGKTNAIKDIKTINNVSKYGTLAAEGMGYGAAQQELRSVQEGGDYTSKETLKKAALGGVIGAGAGVGLGLLGAGARKLFPKKLATPEVVPELESVFNKENPIFKKKSPFPEVTSTIDKYDLPTTMIRLQQEGYSTPQVVSIMENLSKTTKNNKFLEEEINLAKKELVPENAPTFENPNGEAFISGTRKQPSTINVGMKTNVGGDLTEQMVVDEIAKLGRNITRSKIHIDPQENSFAIDLDNALTPEEMHQLSINLKQDAIPQRIDGVGSMHGPGKMKPEWGNGVFNPEFFKEAGDDLVQTATPESNLVKKGTVEKSTIETPKTTPKMEEVKQTTQESIAQQPVDEQTFNRQYDSLKDDIFEGQNKKFNIEFFNNTSKDEIRQYALGLKEAPNGIDKGSQWKLLLDHAYETQNGKLIHELTTGSSFVSKRGQGLSMLNIGSKDVKLTDKIVSINKKLTEIAKKQHNLDNESIKDVAELKKMIIQEVKSSPISKKTMKGLLDEFKC